MNKPLKIILLVLATKVLLVVGYLAYVLIDYHRLGDMDLEVDRQVLQPAETGREYHLLSYNIGFGAYEPDYGVFLDGGTESWAWSQERLTDNIGNIGSFLSQQHADFYLIQEVDRDSTRSYHVDEAALLREALRPNLVQTLEHSPALLHGGPFANIAHGCNSVTATRMALKLGDYAVTEAGCAADLGAEKFFDIKCRLSGLRPSAVVIVATVRALKYHGGVPKAELNRENLSALEKGLPNLLHHVGTIRNTFHLPCVVAVNAFPTDTAEELRLVQERCRDLGDNAVLSEVWAKGGEGGRDLAREVVRLCDQPRLEEFTFAYPDNTSLIYKLNAIVNRVSGGAQAVLTPAAQKQAQQLFDLGFGDLPVCMAKTQYSLSDDPTLLGAPEGFTVTVRNLKVSAGAGFIEAHTGDIMTMPGLPKVPAAEKIDVDEDGKITGLF